MGGGFMKILLTDILRTSLEEVWPSAEHSLGLMYLSAAVKREFGDEVDVRIETLISRQGKEEADKKFMTELLEEYKPDLAGFRSLTIGNQAFHAAVRTVKEWRGECFTAAGGPYPTDDPQGALAGGCLDCAVIGEGEVTFNELAGRILRGEMWQTVPGIAFADGGRVIKTQSRPLIQDIDSLPLPDYSHIDFNKFSNQYLTFTSKISKPHANIMTTRGCPYRCSYCHNILGKRFRARSPESVLAEISFIYNSFGITDFQIIDDIFNFDIARAKRICDLIKSSGMKLTLSFPNAIRADRADDELIDKMCEAGTKFTSIAIETGSPRMQKLIRKNLDLQKAMKTIERCAENGLITRGFFMLGFPTETEEELKQTVDYAIESPLTGATFFTVVYFPGTELHALAKSLGYFKESDYDVIRDYVDVGEGPYEYSLETLTEMKKRAIREFAFSKARISLALRTLPSYFTQREIDGFFMAYVVSSKASVEEIRDEYVRSILKRYFLIADKFSKKSEFYV